MGIGHRNASSVYEATAQQAHEADLTVEYFCEGVFGFEAYCMQLGTLRQPQGGLCAAHYAARQYT